MVLCRYYNQIVFLEAPECWVFSKNLKPMRDILLFCVIDFISYVIMIFIFLFTTDVHRWCISVQESAFVKVRRFIYVLGRPLCRVCSEFMNATSGDPVRFGCIYFGHTRSGFSGQVGGDFEALSVRGVE